MRRQDCGRWLPTFQSNDVDWECGECNGAYSTELNKTQTIAAKAGGTLPNDIDGWNHRWTAR